jgi:hypothetical protein
VRRDIDSACPGASVAEYFRSMRGSPCHYPMLAQRSAKDVQSLQSIDV